MIDIYMMKHIGMENIMHEVKFSQKINFHGKIINLQNGIIVSS